LFDLLIRNGVVIDGSGKHRAVGDIGVYEGRIAAVGRIGEASAARVLDADGLSVAPGFIDLHSHSDFTLLLDGRAESFVRQGVTTEVIGNCGLSGAPLQRPGALKRNVFCYRDPFEANWSTMAGYCAELEKRDLGINVAPLTGHAAIRSSVLGFERRHASALEIERMGDLLRDSLEEGAWGLSSGLEYFPGTSASKPEIDHLCRIIGAYGGLYATHVRNRDEQYQDGFMEALTVARDNDVRLQISHAVPKYGAPEEAVGWLLERLLEAAELSDVACDVIPYEWGPTTMTALLPAELLKNEISEIVAKLREESTREMIRTQDPFFWLLIRDRRWDLIQLYHSEKFPHLIGKNGFELADSFGTPPFDALLDILAEEGEKMFGVLMMGKIKRAGDLAELIKYPRCGVISDGLSLSPTGPLKDINWSPGCYGWVPRFIETFVGKGKSLSLEEGIARITGFAASRLGLTDRGLIKKGNWADIVVFDDARMIDSSSLREPAVFAEGVRHVLVNGVSAVENGRYLGTTNGRLLRRIE